MKPAGEIWSVVTVFPNLARTRKPVSSLVPVPATTNGGWAM